MNGSDLEVTSNTELEAPNSQYISQAQCAQCTKQEKRVVNAPKAPCKISNEKLDPLMHWERN